MGGSPPAPGAAAAAAGRPAPSRAAALRGLRRFLGLVYQVSPRLALATVALRVVRACLPVAGLLVAKELVDQLARDARAGAGLDWGRSGGLLAAAVATFVVADVVGRASGVAELLLGDLFADRIAGRLMRRAASLGLATVEDPRFCDRLERARAASGARVFALINALGLAQDAVGALALAAAMLAVSPAAFALLVAAGAPVVVGELKLARRVHALNVRWTPERRELEYLRAAASGGEAAKEVRSFGLGDHLAARHDALADRYYAENRRLAVRQALVGGALAAIAVCGFAAAVALAAARLSAGTLGVGALAFLGGAVARGRALAIGAAGRAGALLRHALHVDDLLAVLDAPAPPARSGRRAVPRPFGVGLELRDVGFRYPGAERFVLRHVSLALPRGERLALVGDNGAGKSTLLRLIAGLYQPCEGAILLDGVDLREYDPDALRAAVAVVFQDFVRWRVRAFEDVGFGAVEALDDRPRIERAAAAAGADAVIARLPAGFEQRLGREFAGGVDLSMGEWQRLAVARAHVREAELLLLDEPTAALDPRAEHELLDRLLALTAGRTAVLVSHRLSTARRADRIALLEGGLVVELGGHEELVARGGRYADLFALQAGHYRR